MQRVDWRRAIGVYEQIRKLDPADERARLTLMQLYYRFNRPQQAIAEIDALLKAYRDAGRQERMFTVLEDAVRERENDIPLRARLAQVYLNAGRAEDALKHLDKLGDLQMAAERYKEARATVRAIIALNPPNVAEYQELLGQLS
jgi:tetratricopeptide (TPR) repeat protein